MPRLEFVILPLMGIIMFLSGSFLFYISPRFEESHGTFFPAFDVWFLNILGVILFLVGFLLLFLFLKLRSFYKEEEEEELS